MVRLSPLNIHSMSDLNPTKRVLATHASKGEGVGPGLGLIYTETTSAARGYGAPCVATGNSIRVARSNSVVGGMSKIVIKSKDVAEHAGGGNDAHNERKGESKLARYIKLCYY